VAISDNSCTPVVQQSVLKLEHELLNLGLNSNLQHLLRATLEWLCECVCRNRLSTFEPNNVILIHGGVSHWLD
jgi:hypothetical protein